MKEQKKSWPGRFYEDFEVGDVYQHPLGRTVTTTDNLWFTLLTQNTNPIHFDAAYAAKTEFGKPLVNSALTLAIVAGMNVSDVSQKAIANLGWDKIKLTAPSDGQRSFVVLILVPLLTRRGKLRNQWRILVEHPQDLVAT